MLLGSIIAAASSSAVAIVAIIVSGLVGVAAPIATGVFAGKRTTRELDAHDKRQERALNAEQARLEQQLSAESDRLRITHAAEAARLAEIARREVLEQACMALIMFRSTTTKQPRPSQELMSSTVREIASHRARLLLWFDENAKVVRAYVNSLYACAEYAEATKRENAGDATEQALARLDSACTEYFEAAREHVSSLA